MFFQKYATTNDILPADPRFSEKDSTVRLIPNNNNRENMGVLLSIVATINCSAKATNVCEASNNKFFNLVGHKFPS